MKPGTLVICINAKNSSLGLDWKPLVQDKIYTVRGIGVYMEFSGIYLEEIHNGFNSAGIEFGYKMERFRELDTPLSIGIEEILEKTHG